MYWSPQAGVSWQIVLNAALQNSSLGVSVFDIDLFSNPKSTIDLLHQNSRHVICYFSAGSYEDFRPDSSNFTPADYGKPLQGWQGEWWLNTNSSNVRSIMTSRLDLAVSKGCDGVDPDNTDGYANDSGLDLTEDTAVEYMKFLADAAHSRNLSIGLKNSGAIIPQVIDDMQWAVNEQCVAYDECSDSRPFIDANKPVFGIEYPRGAPNLTEAAENTVCDNPQRAGFSTLLKELSLNEWYYACAVSGNGTATVGNSSAPTSASTSAPSSTPIQKSAAALRKGLNCTIYLVYGVILAVFMFG